MKKCEFCKKEYDMNETIRIYGDAWWVGICCSAQCYTKRCYAKGQIANTPLELMGESRATSDRLE